MKFDGEIIVIFNGDAIGKHILAGYGVGIIRLIKGLDAHLHAF
jgi:hypothetical protein